MGRRKIEIQPITNERNRSVTFLKRKNGLFKKAHELGVLCSVDVAVIIFDERHGHDTKLFQYSSSDVRDIIQRHLRHTGEKDTRGPSDFSDNPGARNDQGGDMDDDDDDGDPDEATPLMKKGSRSKDDDDYVPPSAPEHKRRPQKDTSVSASDRHRSNITLSPFPPIPQFDNQHPVSSDRLYPIHHQRPFHDLSQNKKPRLDYGPDLSTSHIPRHVEQQQLPSAPSDDPMQRPTSSTRGFGQDSLFGYHPDSQLFRQGVPSDSAHVNRPSHYPLYGIPYNSSAPPHQQQNAQNFAQHPFSTSPTGFPPPLGLQQLPGPPPWHRTTNGSGLYPSDPAHQAGPTSGSSNTTYEELSVRVPSSFPRRTEEDTDDDNAQDDDGRRRESFASAFLEAEQQRKIVGRATSAASFGLEWPTHQPTATQPPPPRSVTPPAAAKLPLPPSSPKDKARDKEGTGVEESDPPPGTVVSSSNSGSGDVGWLDLLSGVGTGTGGGGGGGGGGGTSASGTNLVSTAEASSPLETPRPGSAAASTS